MYIATESFTYLRFLPLLPADPAALCLFISSLFNLICRKLARVLPPYITFYVWGIEPRVTSMFKLQVTMGAAALGPGCARRDDPPPLCEGAKGRGRRLVQFVLGKLIVAGRLECEASHKPPTPPMRPRQGKTTFELSSHDTFRIEFKTYKLLLHSPFTKTSTAELLSKWPRRLP